MFACPASNLPAILEIQGNIDDLFSQQDLMDDEKAKRYFQLQNRYLALKKKKLNSRTRTRPEAARFQNYQAHKILRPLPLTFNVTPDLKKAAILQKP